MSQSRVFQSIVSELSELLPYVRLKLPASPTLVQQQMGHLTHVQKRLEIIREKVTLLSGSIQAAPTNAAYQALVNLVRELHHDIRELKLLAEEYPIDPDGTLSCLQSREGRAAELTRRFQALLPTQVQPGSAISQQWVAKAPGTATARSPHPATPAKIPGESIREPERHVFGRSTRLHPPAVAYALPLPGTS